MHSDPAPQSRSGPQQAHPPSHPATKAGYREEMARIRVRRAEERDRIADERDRIADERDRIADEREALADRRERAADRREARLDAALLDRGHNRADPGSGGREVRDRAAARTARSLAMISRERSAGQRDEATQRRATAVAPYWPGRLDSEATRTEFLTIMQHQRKTIAESRAAVHIARTLCQSARETVAQMATARALKPRP